MEKCSYCGADKPHKKPARYWRIGHPGGQGTIECATFEECMEKWFEGFNIPVEIINGEAEDFPRAHARVSAWFKREKK